MKTYNKLVRDLIPDIIEKSGKSCDCSVLATDEYLEKLDAKLIEECGEYQESKSLEELADMLEVIQAITVARGHSVAELETVRQEKAKARGGFVQRIFLKTVTE